MRIVAFLLQKTVKAAHARSQLRRISFRRIITSYFLPIRTRGRLGGSSLFGLRLVGTAEHISGIRLVKYSRPSKRLTIVSSEPFTGRRDVSLRFGLYLGCSFGKNSSGQMLGSRFLYKLINISFGDRNVFLLLWRRSLSRWGKQARFLHQALPFIRKSGTLFGGDIILPWEVGGYIVLFFHRFKLRLRVFPLHGSNKLKNDKSRTGQHCDKANPGGGQCKRNKAA